MKRYEKYKPSGVDWIDEVPEHWEVTKLRKLGTFSASGIDKKIVEGEPLVHIINYVDVYRNPTKELREGDYMIVSAPAEKIKEHQVNVGDMIFLPTSETYEDLGLSAVVMDQLDNTAFSYHVLRFTCASGIDINYKKYITNNNFCLSYFSSCGTGTIRKTLSREIFKSCPVFLPPIDEQQTMAAFLNARCADIDKVVATQEKRIALLNEMKQSIITQAVTRGLNPDAKMKDSGVEWIGMVPEHWEKCRFKNFMVLMTKPSDSLVKIGLENIESQTGKFVSTDSEFEGNGTAFQEGDILYGKLRPYLQKVWLAEFDGNAVGDFFVFRAQENSEAKYLKYLLLSDGFTKEANGATEGAKMPRVSSEFILSLKFCLPSREEQKEIADYLDGRCAEIDKQIGAVTRQIELLTEYKQSLITEVVTGKRKVC